MPTDVSERTIEMLRDSLPAMNAHRSAIIDGISSSLAAADPPRDEWRASRVATSLVGMLIDEARHLVSGDGPGDVEAIRLEHERAGIERFHHSRFGDAIAAVMMDAGGAALPKSIGGAWGDTFWAVIRRMEAVGRPGAALGQKSQQPAGTPRAERLMSLA